MADDLGDDWWVGEKSNKSHKKKKSNIVPTEALNDENFDESKNGETKGKSKKRKREKLENDEISEVSSHNKAEKKKMKKKKTESVETRSEEVDEINTLASELKSNDVSKEKNEKKKKSKHKRKKITDWLTTHEAKPLTPSDLTSTLAKHFEGKLSVVEMDEINLQDENFALCNDLGHNPVSFLKTLFPKWKKAVERTKSLPRRPLLIIVCPSGLRSVELIRTISEFKVGNCKIAKLFAKHLKLEDQQKFLQKETIHIGVGTPNRLQLLFDNGDLSLDHAKSVVLDWSWRDAKKRRMVDIDQVRTDVFSLLKKTIIPHVKSGSSCKLALL